MPKEAARGLAHLFKVVRFGTLRAVLEPLNVPTFGAILDRHGIHDMVGVNGLDPSRHGCMLTIVVRKTPHSPRTGHVWQRLAAHISAGNRLRTTLAALSEPNFDPTQRAEAVLTANGKVEHATGPAESRAAREALRDALVRIDKARSEQDDARRSVDLWRGLVAGRWSLVEHFERDGKRFYLAHKNDPELEKDRALTDRERQVLGYAELGYSNKFVSYALGLSSSTVSTLLARARRKMGIVS
jgi:DNA-binding CsgD family transcriptional regulator